METSGIGQEIVPSTAHFAPATGIVGCSENDGSALCAQRG